MKNLNTIGHSTHSIEHLVELLSMQAVSAVADVRSSPYSRHNPQFNREPLQSAFKGAGIDYVFLGRELGARTEDPTCYVDGKVQFDLIARTKLFQIGLDRLRRGMESHRIALLCAEKDPIACHRMILVCRNIRSEALQIQHILEDGSLEDNRDAERRLMRSLGIREGQLFATDEELLEKAYDTQGQRMAYEEKKDA